MCVYIYIYCSQKTHLRSRDRQTESESMEKGIPCKWKSKESQSSNIYIRQTDFKIKTAIRVKEGHYIIIKGSIQDITIVNIYAFNTGALPYLWQIVIDMEGEIDSNTIIVGDFNTPFTSMDKSSSEKINRETQVLMIH